jgi:hypothetical protein
MSETTEQKLNALAEYQAQRDLIDMYKQDAINAAFPAEVKQALADIEAEFANKAAAVNANIEELTKQIKDDILVYQTTVKGTYLQAVWSKGRTTWDTKELEKLTYQYPSVLRCMKTGEPSVAIKAVK